MKAHVVDSDLAAVLLVGFRTGLVTHPDIVRIIDREIETRQATEAWLIDASMARSTEDLLHVLHERAGEHPMLNDAWLQLEAMNLAFVRGVDALRVGSSVQSIYPHGEWPAELDQDLYDLYEEATCAHEHGGVPSLQHVEKALRGLLAVARPATPWSAALEYLRA